jgi:hypothetical protein
MEDENLGRPAVPRYASDVRESRAVEAAQFRSCARLLRLDCTTSGTTAQTLGVLDEARSLHVRRKCSKTVDRANADPIGTGESAEARISQVYLDCAFVRTAVDIEQARNWISLGSRWAQAVTQLDAVRESPIRESLLALHQANQLVAMASEGRSDKTTI